MAGALRPMFGENLEAYYAEQERHDAEARELIDRELHEALIEAKERFNRRVQALRIEPEEP